MAPLSEMFQASLFAGVSPVIDSPSSVPARALMDGRYIENRKSQTGIGIEQDMSALQGENKLKNLTDRILGFMFHFDTRAQVLEMLRGGDLSGMSGVNPEILSLFSMLSSSGLRSDAYFAVLDNIAASGLLDEGTSLGKLTIPPMIYTDKETGKVIRTPRVFPDLITFEGNEDLHFAYHHKLQDGVVSSNRKLARTHTLQALLQNDDVQKVTVSEMKININDKQRGFLVAHRELRAYKTLIEELIVSNIGIGLPEDYIDKMLSKLQYRVVLANHDGVVIATYSHTGQLLGSEIQSSAPTDQRGGHAGASGAGVRIPETLDPINMGKIIEEYQYAQVKRSIFESERKIVFETPGDIAINTVEGLMSEVVRMCRGGHSLHIYPNAYRVGDGVEAMVFEFPIGKRKAGKSDVTMLHRKRSSDSNSTDTETRLLSELPKICEDTGLSLRQVLWRLVGSHAQESKQIVRHSERWVLTTDNDGSKEEK
ncbi:MAG: hypothetical protein U0525_06150 [Patescibacteria group bacterium]